MSSFRAFCHYRLSLVKVFHLINVWKGDFFIYIYIYIYIHMMNFESSSWHTHISLYFLRKIMIWLEELFTRGLRFIVRNHVWENFYEIAFERKAANRLLQLLGILKFAMRTEYIFSHGQNANCRIIFIW